MNSTVSRLGQVNLAGADDALFLKQFGGEILTEFETTVVFKSRHYVRQIRNGKTAQFPMIGTVSSSYHVPGTFIDGQQVPAAEITLTVDGLLIAPIFLASIDELMNHYDVRGPYATEMGRELAYQYDRNVARCMILAARASSTLTGRAGGSTITNASMATDSAVITSSLFTAAQTLDEKNIPTGDRNSYFRPAQFYLLAQNTTLLNRDFDGNASISRGVIDTVAGFPIIKTNHVPSTNLSSSPVVLPKYRANYSVSVGIVSTRWSVGTVQLMDIAMESDWEPRRQGTFMLAKMAVGHGVLRPECAIELRTGSP
jgi:hypothetical protein